MDIRQRVVFGMAGRRRVDVHRFHSEPVRHIPGPLRGGDAARELPFHHEQATSQGADSGPVGAVVCHMFPTPGRVEGQEGNEKVNH